MVTSLESKMPSDCSFAWENYKTLKRSEGTPIPERELGPRLLTWLDGFIEDKKRSQVKTTDLAQDKKVKKKQYSERPKTLNNFFTIGDQKKVASKCAICDKSHNTTACHCKGMTPQTIRAKIIEAKLCLNCFEDGHYAPECEQSGCKISGCGKPHHHKLHQTKTDSKKKEDKPTGKKSGSSPKESGGSKKTQK